ncbi:(d)CMP kinase [Chlamydiifrater phoenicopteri]|uniref:(d)CMP kinase n=1 Tax=Chlamydiifrater phoenicopteri TaxID=2681469 RepID=UPI001BCB36F9|nr:(d)CMP kinase [Chlamydiifrater phoenicopteri]
MLVTIDGPSGTGKSSVAKAVAEALAFNYCNTGAMYRTLAYAYLKTGCSDTSKLLCEEGLFSFSFSSMQPLQSFFKGEPLSPVDLSEPAVTKTASDLAKDPEVRRFMQKQQREYAKLGNCVFEGRDMGSKVFPEAQIKIFLTATPEVRALRRLKDYPENSISYEELKAALVARDKEDSQRKNDPLTVPEGAFIIDSSELSIKEVTHKILEIISQKL